MEPIAVPGQGQPQGVPGAVSGGGGGWGWNPFTDIMKASTSIGDFINQHTKIGSFNPGIGSVISTVANILPGMANLAYQVPKDVMTGNASALGQIGAGLWHGVEDTSADIVTAGGIAPWTNSVESGMESTLGHYKPQTLKQYATQPGQGLLGGALNDVFNVLGAADGAGALAKTGDIGEAANAAIKAEELGKTAGVDVPGVSKEYIHAAGGDAKEAAVQQAADKAVNPDVNPTGNQALRDQIRQRIQTIERIEAAKAPLQGIINPLHPLRPLGRAAELLRSHGPDQAAEAAASEIGASQGTSEGSPNGPKLSDQWKELVQQRNDIKADMKVDRGLEPARAGGRGEALDAVNAKIAQLESHPNWDGTPASLDTGAPAPATKPYEEPPVPAEHTRLYNGGENNGEMWTSDRKRAQSYAGMGEPIRHIDVPKQIADLKKIDYEPLSTEDKAAYREAAKAKAAAEPNSPEWRTASEKMEEIENSRTPNEHWKKTLAETEHTPVPGKDYYLGERPDLTANPVEHTPTVVEEPTKFISDQTKAYNAEHGMAEPEPVDKTAKVDPVRGRMIAEWMARAESNPNDPRVVKTYSAFAREVMQQWQFLQKQGVKVEFVDRGEGAGAYANAQEMLADVRDNHHLFVDRTGPGEEHLMPQMQAVVGQNPDGTPIVMNDIFRAVHDYFGHAQAENDFSRHGEDVAWRLHAQMFSDEAKPALFTETVGQNSYLNFLPQNVELKRLGLNPDFPDQKAVIAPELYQQPDWQPAGPGVADAMANALPNRTAVPAELKSFFERSAPPPRWAQAIVAKLPGPLVDLLAWTDRIRQAHEYQMITRQQTRALAVMARAVENSGQIEAARQVAVKMVADRVEGVTPGVASDIVGERVMAAVVLGPLWDEVEAMRPDIEAHAPGMTDHILGFSSDLPEENNTPEFRQTIKNVAEPIREMRKQQEAQLRQSAYKGNEGFEHADDEGPTLTAQEMKYVKQIRSLTKQKLQLEAVDIPKALDDAHKAILDANDAITASLNAAGLAAEAAQTAVGVIDEAHAYTPMEFKGPLLDQMAGEVADRILNKGGATRDPHTGEWKEMQDPNTIGYTVGGADHTAIQIDTTDPQYANPADLRQAIIDSIKGVASTYQEAFHFPEMMIGGWRDGTTIHIDPTQFLAGEQNRGMAILLGAARGQEMITEMHTGHYIPTDIYDRNAAAELIGRGNHTEFIKRDNELRAAADKAAAAGVRGLSQEEIDSHMMFLAREAYWAKRFGIVDKNDDYFKTFKVTYADRASRAEGALNDARMMVPNEVKAVKGLVRDAILQQKPESRWYYDAHGFIEKHGNAMPDIELGMNTPWSNPHTVSGKELLYNFVAIMSMNTDPAQNWIWALGGARNWVKVLKERMPELVDAVDEWVHLPQDQRTPTEGIGEKGSTYVPKLLKLLNEDTNKLAGRYMLAVLDGHTIDTWDADFFRNKGRGRADESGLFANYGNISAKPLSEKLIPKEQVAEMGRDRAIMEYHGSNAAAKIRSFYENLVDPENSMAVTLDSWMARLFGPGDTFWGTANTWKRHADTIRTVAAELSAEAGRKVMPHEVQAALWFYAKSQYADINAAVIRAPGFEVMRQLEAGTWTPEADPIALFWQGAVDRAHSLQTGEAAPAMDHPVTNEKEMSPDIVAKGAPIPETQPGKINFNFPRLSKKTGRLTADGNSMVLAQQEYQDVMARVQEELNNPDRPTSDNLEEAKYQVYQYVHHNDVEWEAKKEGLQFWDAKDRPSYHENGFSDSLASYLGITSDVLDEQFANEIRGQFVPGNADTRALVRLFKTGNFVTMFHEQAHLFRSLMTGGDLKFFEQHYGIKNGNWTKDAEELFVRDMISAATEVSDGPLGEHMDRLRATLAAKYGDWQHTYDAAAMHPEIANFWQHFYGMLNSATEAPAAVPELGGIQGLESSATEPTDMSGLTPGQKNARTPQIPVEETPTAQYRRGTQSQAALDTWRQKLMDKRNAEATAAQAQAHVDELMKMINTHSLPEQLTAEALSGQITDASDKLAESIGDASERRVPPKWQPLTEAAKKMADAAAQYPELEPILAGLPQTFGQAFDYAQEHGFDPTHMPDLTPERVRQLVNGTSRLGGEAGREFLSGARKTRTGALRAAGLADKSIEALIAGLVQSTQEDRTNMVVDWIDRGVSQPLGRGESPPKGWVAWDPIRRKMLSSEQPGTPPQGETPQQVALADTRMVPRQVAHAIQEYASTASNPLARAMQTITDPWRFFMLTLNPGFYLHHFAGHILLALMQEEGGFHLSDWVQAYHAARNGFKDLPEVTGLNITQSELGQPGVITYPSVGDALAQGGKREALNYISNQLHKSIAVSDSFARAVDYFSQKRTGASDMEAMQHAMDALVDYGNLSNTEKYFARSLIPFYSFQKGVLKIAMHMPIDHPLVSAVLMQIGKWQTTQAVDDNGNPLPSAYQGVVPMFGHKLNLRSFSPFKDLGVLTTPEGLTGGLQYAIQAVLRAGLGAPAPFTKAGVKVGPYGNVVPDVSVLSQLAATATSSPQGSALANLAGAGTKTPGQAALNFAGIPVANPDTLNKAGARNALSQGEVNNSTPAQQQLATAFPVDTNRLQNILAQQAQTTGGINVPQLAGQASQDAVAKALADQQAKQAAAAAQTRATGITSSGIPVKHRVSKSHGGGGSHRSSRGRKLRISTTSHIAHFGHGTVKRSTKSTIRQAFGKAHRASTKKIV